MAKYMRFFKTEKEAKEFAEKVGGTYGWIKDRSGRITKWYVDYE